MADRGFAPCCDAGIDNATAVNLGAVTGRRGALLHCIRDRATSHGELPQLEQRSDISYWCRFNVASTCCHPTGLRDHQLPAHARTAERYLVRRHLSSLHNERVFACLRRCECRLTCALYACRFMGDSRIKLRCQELRQSFHEANYRQGLGVSPPRSLRCPCSASELLSIEYNIESLYRCIVLSGGE